MYFFYIFLVFNFLEYSGCKLVQMNWIINYLYRYFFFLKKYEFLYCEQFLEMGIMFVNEFRLFLKVIVVLFEVYYNFKKVQLGLINVY